MTKRVISLLLILVMITGMLPVFAQAQEQDAAVDSGELTVEGTNSFGNLVSEEISQAMTEQEEDHEAGYSVTGLEIANGTATVTYDSLEEATLVVALYTEDGTQLLTTATQTVTADETVATLVLPEIEEEYFLAEAFLLDTYDHSPLCESYDTPMYTSDMQELLASTVDDYDPELVYNLDDDKTTNFAVFTEGTVIIEATEGVNTLVSTDDDNYIYVFENADAQLTGLTTGSVVAYLYGDDMLLFKTDYVTVNGNTATVVGAELQIEEIFAYMKLENIGDTSQISVDPSYSDEGITYVGMSGGQRARSWEGDVDATLGYEFELFKEDKTVPDSDGGEAGKVEINGTLKFSLEVKVAYYISLKKQFIEFKVTAAAKLGVEVSGTMNINGWKLARFEFSPIYGVFVRFEPQIKLSFSGKISFSATLDICVGMHIEHSSSGFSTQNLSRNPKLDASLEFEGEVFFGVDLHPTIYIMSRAVAEASMTGLVGVSLKGTLKLTAGKNELTGPMVHECEACIDGDINAVVEVKIDVKFLKSKRLSLSLTLVNLKIKIADFYYSFDKKEIDWGECPHNLYRVNIFTRDDDGVLTENVPVTLSTGEKLGTTNKTGLLVTYQPKGNYTFQADIPAASGDGSQKVSYTKHVTNACSVTLTSSEEYWAYIEAMKKLQVNLEEWLENSTVASGTCGDEAKWTLYASGLLKVTGSGAMKYYNYASETPWYQYQSKIKRVHVTDRVSSVSGSAFYGCNKLETVVLDDCVTSLSSSAFNFCTALKEVKLPVDLITSGAFYSTGNVKKLHYTLGTTGVMKNRGSSNSESNYYGGTLEFYNKDKLQSVTFDDGITEIGAYAFYSCNALTQVMLPATLTSIGRYTFSGCTALDDLRLPEGLEELGEYTFYNCSGLTEIDIPSTVTQIPYSTFYYCTGLTEIVIPDTVTYVGSSAFWGCTGLTKVTIPVDVATAHAFTNTGNIAEIRYTYGTTGIMKDRGSTSNMSNFYEKTLEYCNRSSLKTVTFDEEITTVANDAFYSCTALSKVTLPSTLTSIGNYAFYGCTSLESITLPESLETLGENAFSNCTGLKEIDIPSTVTQIPYSAFYCCTGLTEIVIPDTVTYVGSSAFWGCTGLTKVTIPVDIATAHAFTNTGNITEIRYTYGTNGIMKDRGSTSNMSNFYEKTLEYYNRNSLETVIFDERITTVANHAFYTCTALATVKLPTTLTSIGKNAFYGCTFLEAITLPEDLKNLGESAFSNCAGLKGIIIPSTVTQIPYSAFYCCTGLTEIVIPDTVTYVGSSAFWGCTGLTKVTIPVDVATAHAFTNTGNITQIRYTYGTTGIMKDRGTTSNMSNYYENTLEYSNRSKLETVTFDEGVTTVANQVFYTCTALTTVSLPTTLTSIGKNAFYGCTFLEAITLPEDLKNLGESAFSNCAGLKGIIIPSTVTQIPYSAFYGCTGLTELVIPDTVTYVGSSAFWGCTGLTKVTIPVDVATAHAFTNTGNVTEIRYTYGTNGIMKDRGSTSNISNFYETTLEYCNRSKLKTVSFDKGIKSIANYAFYNCTVLNQITLTGNCPTVGGSRSFYNVSATIYYPSGNTTYTDAAKNAFGSNMTWVPYVSGKSQAVISNTIIGGVVESHIPTANAAFGGDNQSQVTDDRIFQLSTFQGLVPGEQYVILAVVDAEAEDLLAADNVLYIDQAAAFEDGTLNFRYVQRVPTDEFYVFVCGASDKNLQNAQITVPEMTANGEAQAFQPTVTYDGQVLVEELHYVIAEGAVFTEAGTYTATIRGINDYSGTVSYTYTVQGGAEVVQPTLKLKAPALEFKDMITVNAFFTAENIQDVVEMGMITYTEKVAVVDVATAAHVIPGAILDESTGRYFASSQGIHAKYLGDTVYLACYAKLTDGSYVYTSLASYSPVQYATNQLKGTDMKLKQLCAAMLNYGAAAQNYFGYNTDVLANSTLTAEQIALPEAYTSDMVGTVPAAPKDKQGAFASNKGFGTRKPAVSFEGAFSINYFFTPSYTPVDGITLYYWTEADFNAADVLTVENASGAVAMTDEGSQFRGDIEGIAAKDLAKAIYVAAVYSDGTTTWTSGVLGYSIGAYCSSQATGTGTMAELAKATAVYGYHAKAYFG